MKDATLPNKENCDPKARIENTIYEYDREGKPVEWDYPSGKATVGGLNLKGLGLQKTNSEKETYFSDAFDDIKKLANRFLNLGEEKDWHPTSLWTAQLAAKGAAAAICGKNKPIETSITDEYFAFQRVGGLNPALLKKVVDEDSWKDCMQPGKSYYMVDYQSLEILEDNDRSVAKNEGAPVKEQRFAYFPKALFEVEDNYLKPTAIEIKRHGNSKIVKPSDAKWEIAKFIVQNADINYHEIVSHLGKTHFYVEAFAVATGKCLPKDEHPVSLLLRPHFEGTVNINDFSTTDLVNVSPDVLHTGVIDSYFAGTIASNIKLIAEEVFGFYAEDKLDSDKALAEKIANLFNRSIFPRDIENRGVGYFEQSRIESAVSSEQIGIDVYHTYPANKANKVMEFHYPYLDDACKLWNTITNWVCRYIDVYYKNDDDVKQDCELQCWANTVFTEGKIQGFGEYIEGDTISGEIHTRAYLVQALTSIIFTASVQHAAVNFPQAEYGPTLPAGIYRDFFLLTTMPM